MKKTMCNIIAYIVVILLAMNNVGGGEGVIGMNWGRQNAQRLVPSMVVDLLLQNGIKAARVYSSQEDILKAFSGSGIDLTITVFGFNQIAHKDQAMQWFNLKSPYIDSARISRIYVGLDAFAKGVDDKEYLNHATTTYTLIQNVVNEGNYGDSVKVTIPNPDIVLNLENVTRPSDADFKDEIKEEMHKFLRSLQANRAPLVIELFPIYYAAQKKMGISFAIPGQSTQVIKDINGAVYTNAFAVLYDSFVWAITKAGVPDLDIVVGSVGWPTDGFEGANASSAELFYKHFLPYVTGNEGTPMRPGKPIDIYLHSLTDENLNSGTITFARHWGIYRTNGEPKFRVDLSGQGRDVFPARAKGIQRMPERWCVYREEDHNKFNRTDVKEKFKDACMSADCTSLTEGGSCSGMRFSQNVSYAFNMFFQARFQDERACRFEGYAKVVTDNPSTGTCVFPVEVVRGQQDNSVLIISGQARLLCHHQLGPRFALVIFLYFSLSVFWVLL